MFSFWAKFWFDWVVFGKIFGSACAILLFIEWGGMRVQRVFIGCNLKFSESLVGDCLGSRM